MGSLAVPCQLTSEDTIHGMEVHSPNKPIKHKCRTRVSLGRRYSWPRCIAVLTGWRVGLTSMSRPAR